MSGNKLDFSSLSPEEIKRIRERRKWARRTPEQRHKHRQYQRRHNEKDGRLYYCDYCDVFVSTSEKSWSRHLNGLKHMDNMYAYYQLVEQVEEEAMEKIRNDVLEARGEGPYCRDGAGKSQSRNGTRLPPPTDYTKQNSLSETRSVSFTEDVVAKLAARPENDSSSVLHSRSTGWE